MDSLGREGISCIVKVDHERMADGGKPWTVVLSGPGTGGEAFIRTDSASLQDGLDLVLRELRSSPGEWGWLEHWSS